MSAAHAVAMLKLAYRQDFGDERAMFYGMKLAGLPDDLVEAAVSRLIDTSTFLPSIAEIKAECAELALNLPTPEEAWTIAAHGSLREAAEPVRVAAEHVGGRWAILHSDNIDTVRAQFRKAYVSARDRAVRDWISPRHALPGLAPPQALGETMKALPESERFKPRPVMTRLMQRWANRALAPPTEEEKRDAILVLGDESGLWTDPADDPLYAEAERIFREGGVENGDV